MIKIAFPNKIKNRALLISLFLVVYFGIFHKILLSRNPPVGEDWAIPISSTQLKNWLIDSVYSWSTWGNIFGKRLSFSVALPFQIVSYFLNILLTIDGYSYWKALFLGSFLMGGLSSYFLFLKYGFKKFFAFLGAIIFTLNPVIFNFLLMGWTWAFISIFSLPLILLTLEKYFDNKKKSLIILIAIIYGILGFMESQSIFHFMVFIAAYILIRSKQTNSFPIKQILRIILPIILIIIALHAHWLLGLFLVHDPYITSTVAPNDILRFALRFSFRDIIRGWGSVFNYQFEYSYPLAITFFSFLGPIIIITSVLLKKLKRISIFFLFLFFYPLLMYFLSQHFLIYISYTNVIRDYERSFPYIFFAFGYFFGLFFSSIKNKNVFVKFLSLSLVAVYIFPFWNGNLYRVKNNKAMGISLHDIDQRLRFYHLNNDLTKIDNNLGKLQIKRKAVIMPLGYGFTIPSDRRFNGLWASFNDYSSNLLKNIRNVSGFNNTEKQLLLQYKNIFNNDENCKSNVDIFFQRLSSYGFSYIALRKNVVGAADNISSANVEKCLSFSKHITPIINYERYKLYKINLSAFLPHFYIPQNIIYSPNDIEVLPDIVSFNNYEIRSATFLADNAGKSADNTDKNGDNAEKEQITLIKRADEIFVEGKIRDNKYWILDIEEGKKNIFYPAVKHNPSSWQWKLVLLKEKYDQWKVRKEPEKLMEKKLFYGNKRINELKEFYADNADKDAESADKERITRIIKMWREDMKGATGLLDKIKDEEKRAEWTIKIKRNIEDNKRKLENMPLWDETDRNMLADASEIEKLEEKLDKYIPKINIEEREYAVEIPREGKYTLLIKRNISANADEINRNMRLHREIKNWKVEIDGEKITDNADRKTQITQTGWVEWGKANLEEGKHILLLRSNADNTDNKIQITQIKGADNADGGVAIAEWRNNQWYQVEGKLAEEAKIDQGKIVIEEKSKAETEIEGEEKEAEWKGIKTYQPNENEFTFYFESGDSSEEGRLLLENITFEDFEDLSIKPVWMPKIVLRSETTDNTNKDMLITRMPKIEFVKINPTKYKIKVTDATEPYTLVFSESFHEGWKVYTDNADKKRQITLMGAMGKVASKVTKLFLKNKGYGEEVASYFDGEIKEGTHQMTFLEPATFKTWGKEPVAEDNHLSVNGYANSWYINTMQICADKGACTDNADGSHNYELIVEFWPQRLFYIGLGISLITLTGCVIYLMTPLIKRTRTLIIPKRKHK